MVLAIFDFDGTISCRDSFRHFLQYAVGRPVYYRGLVLLSPTLIAYALGLLSNHVAKQKVFAHFFRGCTTEDFAALAEKYSFSEIRKIVRPAALVKIEWHQKQGHKVVVVSASITSWLSHWCTAHGVDLVATEIEEENQVLTGQFRTLNCYGSEKVERLKDQYDFSEIEYVYAYGDSRGDKEMLDLADEKYYRYF